MNPEKPFFKDRTDAGQQLAFRLQEFSGKRPLILALPRGGVPVGYEIARALHAPLDTLVARKIGAPNNMEFAIGAISPGDVIILEKETIEECGIDQKMVDQIIVHEMHEMERRIERYQSGTFSQGYVPDSIIVVDDGVATGLTAYAALESVRMHWNVEQMIFAAPVCSERRVNKLRDVDVHIFCAHTVEDFMSIGEWYADFSQVTDEEVMSYLRQAEAKFRREELLHHVHV